MTTRTWDGLPVSSKPPFGATIVVWRTVDRQREWLILHRAHNGVTYDGDWAWTPPAGSRRPGESVAACAARELREEAGLALTLVPVLVDDCEWAIFQAEAPRDVVVAIDDEPEHDRYEWTTLAAALSRCRPVQVADGIRQVADLLGDGPDVP